jgi:transcription elongation factor SPT6
LFRAVADVQVRRGFIVDESEEEEGESRRKKKKRRRSGREEEVEQLDDEDLDLIGENYGGGYERKEETQVGSRIRGSTDSTEQVQTSKTRP